MHTKEILALSRGRRHRAVVSVHVWGIARSSLRLLDQIGLTWRWRIAGFEQSSDGPGLSPARESVPLVRRDRLVTALPEFCVAAPLRP